MRILKHVVRIWRGNVMFSYNTLNRIYYVVGCLFIGICVYLLLVDAVPFLACLLMLDLSLWCVGSVCRTTMQKRENTLISLMHECKIAEFIEKYSHEHAYDTKRGFSTSAAILLATAHIHLDDIETSLKMFQSIELQNPQKVRKKLLAGVATQCAVYHNNLSTVYLRRHDIENAKLHMEKAQEYLKQLQGINDKKGKNSAAIEILTRSLINRELELALELGSELDYAEKIDQLKYYLDEAENVLNRVYYHYLLYVLYGKTGNADETRKCREYVRENGGDTCYVQWVEI